MKLNKISMHIGVRVHGALHIRIHGRNVKLHEIVVVVYDTYSTWNTPFQVRVPTRNRMS